MRATPGTDVTASAVHASIAAPLAALEAARVRWLVLRGDDELHTVDGDVDLLVAAADRAAARSALAAAGFARQAAWGRAPHEFQVAPLAAGEHVKLDIVWALAYGRYGELPTPWAADVLARRVRRADGLWTPAPADAFWTLLAHVLLDRDHIRPERAAQLQELAPAARASAGEAEATFLASACPAGWDGPRLVDAVQGGTWAELEALSPHLAAHWPTPAGSVGRHRREATVVARRLLRKASRLQQSGAMTRNNASRSTG